MRPFVFAVGAALVAACSNPFASTVTVAGTAPDLAFHAEADPLPSFGYDTGPQPKSGPAQLDLKLSASGKIAADAAATAQAGKLVGKPGAGALTLDVHVKAQGHLHVDAAGYTYDGDLPGMSGFDVPIDGKTTFDGLLLAGDPAVVTADIPETKLPDIPLGSVPGHLSLTIAAGSQLKTSYRGTCAEVKAGQATLHAAASTSGTLLLRGTIVLDIPLHAESVDLPQITVPIPATTAALDSKPVAAPGLADWSDPSCAAPSSGDASGSTDADAAVPPAPPPTGADGGAPDAVDASAPASDAGDPFAPSSGYATLSIDGNAMSVGAMQLITGTTPGAIFSVSFSGPGFPAGSVYQVVANGTGLGCATSSMSLRPEGGDTYASGSAADCGLVIWSLPDATGGELAGSYSGTLTSMNDPSAIHTLTTEFHAQK